MGALARGAARALMTPQRQDMCDKEFAIMDRDSAPPSAPTRARSCRREYGSAAEAGVSKVNRPRDDQFAHFRVTGRTWISMGSNPRCSAHGHTSTVKAVTVTEDERVTLRRPTW
jgi:hypothetical protein